MLRGEMAGQVTDDLSMLRESPAIFTDMVGAENHAGLDDLTRGFIT